MKVTFEGLEFNFSMGAISIECDPKETESFISADVRKHEISEGDLTCQIKRTIFACVKDAMGSAASQQQPKQLVQVPEDKPKPEPTACMPKPVEESEPEDGIVEAELEEPKKKYGPKQRRATSLRNN